MLVPRATLRKEGTIETTNDARISSDVHDFDSATTLMQLGLIPEPFMVPA